MKTLQAIVIFIMFSSVIFGQALKINSIITQKPNTKIVVPVDASGMPSVCAISIYIKYNTSVMKFDSISNTHNGMSYIYNDNSGSIGFSWFSFTPENLTNTKLFDLNFSYWTGDSNVDFVSSVCSISEPNLKTYNIIYTNGSVRGNFTSVETDNQTPEKYYITQNYPNPFNPSTKIEFNLPQSGHTNISVFDITGREVASLVNGNMSSGKHQLDFNANNLPAGVYIYKITSGGFSASKKMQLIK